MDPFRCAPDRCARPRPKQNFVAVGTNDGQIAMYQLNFTTVHGLYQVGRWLGPLSGTATLPILRFHVITAWSAREAHSCCEHIMALRRTDVSARPFVSADNGAQLSATH